MKMKKKRLLCLLLSLVMVLGLLPEMRLTAYAANEVIYISASNVDRDRSGPNWSYNGSTHTLTLSNYRFEGTGVINEISANTDPTVIYYESAGSTFHLVLEGNNTIVQGRQSGKQATWGIYSKSDCEISGTGTLTVSTVDGEVRGAAIYAEKNLTIKGDCTVNATSGSVTGTAQGYGIGGGNGTILTIEENANVTLTGPKGGTNVTVKNAAPGVGWTDVAGNQGEAAIEANPSTGQNLISYNKVMFPAYIVTYKIVNGTWSDSTTTDKTEVVVSGSKPTSVPTGMIASSGYTGGSWDTDPTDATITAAMTFTYTFEVAPVASVTSGGTTTNYTDFASAVTAWNSAASGATLTLLADVTTITINFSGTKTLDLNGHSLTGNGNGTVIKVNGGSLTVNGKNGTITGGKAVEGGAFFITSNGKVTLNDCTLKGNEATNVGDAFFIQSRGGGGSAIINNCTIIGRGKDKGAALWLQGHNNPDTSFTMNGGSISNFKIGVWVQGKTDLGTSMFTMNGGTISDNKIGVKNEGPNSKVIVSGDAIISNNDEKNLELNDGIKVTVNSALGKNAKIGIYMGNSGVFTNSTPTDYNDATKFTSDKASYAVGKNTDGQLYLDTACTVTYKVVGGAWSDGTTEDKTETVASGSKPASVPTGMTASEGYTGGAWDTDPTDATITAATTFTYTFEVAPVASVTSGGTTTNYTDFASAVTAWNSAASGATLTLLADVTTITINFSGTKTLDLNGHSLTGNGNGTVIKVNGGSLTVNGKNGTITGGKAVEGGAFFITSNGKVTLNDCTLKGNEATNVGDAFFIQSRGGGGSAIINNCTIIGRGKDKGAALWLQGHNNPDTSFTMNGGSISNFKIGVWVQGKTDLGTSMFTMNGGTISDNKIGVKNEGPNSKVIVSGDAIISNNDEKNLELNDGIKVTVNSALGKNAKIGIYMGNSGVFTNSTPTDYNYATKFTSDNASYAVGKNTDGQLFLGTPINSVAVTDITAPAATEALDTAAATSTEHVTLADSGAITWDPAAPQDGKAAYATEYTATVTATADDNYAFADGATATVNGETATVTKNDDGTLSIAYTFSKTALTPVTITATDKEVTYSADGIAIPVDGMFAITEGAGEATYSVTNGTGEGIFAEGKLTVTKCGTFTVKVSTAATETYAAGAETTATLTVNKADSTAATVTANNRTYDGTEQPLVTVEGEPTGGTMQYALGTETKATEQYTTSIPTATNAGTYYVWYKAVGDDNHEDTAPSCVTVNINKAEVTAPAIASKIYKAQLQTADVVESSLYSVTKNEGGTNVGSYDVVLTLTDAANYKWTDSEEAAKTLTFQITQKAATVATPTLNAVTYDPAKTLANVTLPDGWTWADNSIVPAVRNSGYAAVYTVPDDTNYDYSTVEGYSETTHKVTRTVSLTVNKASSTITKAPTANELTYNGTAQELVTPGAADGGDMYYVSTDTNAVPTEGWTTSIPTGTDAGTYYVWYKVVGDTDHLDVDPACVTVTIVEPSSNANLALGDDTTNVTVTGLDNLAEESAVDGKTVVVTMTVDKKDKTEVEAADSAAIETAADGMRLEYIDISLTKTVNGEESALTDTNTVLEIVVPYTLSNKTQTTVTVYRYHDGVATKLTEADTKADGTYRLDWENDLIYIYASKFSTYAIGFTPTYKVSGTLSGTFTGTVSFSLTGNGVTKTASGTVMDGKVSYSFTGVPAGTYSVKASWRKNGRAQTLTFQVTVTAATS